MDYKNDIHHLHDKSYKDLYSKSEVACDLFKSTLGDKIGKYLKPENLKLSKNSYVTADYEELEADIVYEAKINNCECLFYILLEFQSTVDYRMPIRLLFYISEILRDYSINAKHKKYNSKIKIPAVIPIVLYNGNKVWDAQTQFRKLVYNEEIFGDTILDFKYHILDISNDKKFEKEKLLQSKSVTSAIFLLDQKIEAEEFLERIKEIALYFNSLSDMEIKALKQWLKNTVVKELAEPAIEILETEGREVREVVARNAFILDEMKEKAEKKGEYNKALKDAENFLKLGVSEEIVSKGTGIPIDKILEIKKNINKN